MSSKLSISKWRPQLRNGHARTMQITSGQMEPHDLISRTMQVRTPQPSWMLLRLPRATSKPRSRTSRPPGSGHGLPRRAALLLWAPLALRGPAESRLLSCARRPR